MLFKNDSQIKRFNQEQPHFSIRKLSVGAASVLIGISLMGFTNQSVKADTVSEPTTEETTKTNTNNSDQQTLKKNNVPSVEQSSTVEKENSSNTEQNSVVEKQDGTTDKTSQSTVPTSNQANTEVINEYPKTNVVQGQNLNASSKPSDSQSTDTQNKALKSLDEAKKAPAVQPAKGNEESNGEDIKGINSKITITGENKYTGKTSESSAKNVEVNPSITKDLNMVITIENNSDTDKNISTSYPDNAYALPAYNGRKNANIVVDSSRVTINNNQVTFGGNYQDAGLTITNWDAANEQGSSGFNNKEETIAKIVNDPSLIGGFQISGTIKAHQIATIIVPLKVVNPDQKSGGSKFERQYGQAVVISLDPEGGRSAGDYTSVNSSVDTLVDNNIANLADNDGNLTLNADVTNGGLLTHQETLEFNLNNIANFNNNHQVHVVFDHSKEINLDWAGINGDSIQYKVNGVYKTASQMTDADWKNVTAVKVNAGLASGATGKISIPVKVQNVD